MFPGSFQKRKEKKKHIKSYSRLYFKNSPSLNISLELHCSEAKCFKVDWSCSILNCNKWPVGHIGCFGRQVIVANQCRCWIRVKLHQTHSKLVKHIICKSKNYSSGSDLYKLEKVYGTIIIIITLDIRKVP